MAVHLRAGLGDDDDGAAVKLAGNAVTPPVMTHIVGRLAAALEAS